MLRYRPRLLHLHTYVMLRDRPRLLHLQTYVTAAKSVCIRVGSTKLGKTSKNVPNSIATRKDGAPNPLLWQYATQWQWRWENSACANLSRLTAETLRANMQWKSCARKKAKSPFFLLFSCGETQIHQKTRHPETASFYSWRSQKHANTSEKWWKIKHNGIDHILWPKKMMIASQVLQIPWYKHEGHHKDSWEHDKTHAR